MFFFLLFFSLFLYSCNRPNAFCVVVGRCCVVVVYVYVVVVLVIEVDIIPIARFNKIPSSNFIAI